MSPNTMTSIGPVLIKGSQKARKPCGVRPSTSARVGVDQRASPPLNKPPKSRPSTEPGDESSVSYPVKKEFRARSTGAGSQRGKLIAAAISRN